jgi:DNA-binding PadR family transcriptional regulator
MGRGDGPGSFDDHDDGFLRGRKFGSDELQLILLALLALRASHGYELIKEIEQRSGGCYCPSPGVIYPALTYLEEVGYTAVQSAGSKKCYALTDDGLQALERQRPQADALLAKLALFGERFTRMRDALAASAAEPALLDRVHAARHQLKGALAQKLNAEPAEQQRIAVILERAAADILNTKAP